MFLGGRLFMRMGIRSMRGTGKMMPIMERGFCVIVMGRFSTRVSF